MSAYNGNDNGNTGHESHEWLIPEEGRTHLEDIFRGLQATVTLHVFTDEAPDPAFNNYMKQFALDLSLLSEKIEAYYYPLDSDEAKRLDVTVSPTLLVNPDQYRIRFTGAPLGEEARALIETIFLVSLGTSGLSPTSKQILDGLEEERHPVVFSSPGCPYCPGQFMNAVKCAIEKPELVTAECVNADEFPDLSAKHGVGGVPHTVFGQHNAIGMMPEERFVLEMVTEKDAEEALRQGAAGFGQTQEQQGLAVEEFDVVILGAGPAGLTAGIYAERAGLKSVVIDKSVIGGQVTTTPIVENYPGFKNVGGMNLVEVLTAHTREYSNVRENQDILEVKIGKKIEVHTTRGVYLSKSLIFATGAKWRALGIPGEQQFFGTGVSHCASCDGYMFKGKKIVLVGGGNTALTDALHLKNLGVDVTIVHRRGSFRAEKALQDSLEREGIPVIWNTVVDEIAGADGKVDYVKLRDVETDNVLEFACDGMFVAIGLDANTGLASDIGVHLENDGTIKVDRSMRTNIPRVYAAGDVTGGVRQIVTAVGEGATAALSSFEDLQNPYWKKSG